MYQIHPFGDRRLTMRVLYLLPQAKQPDRIGGYTFLDEEISALSRAGLDAYGLSTAAPADSWCGKVRLLSVAQRSSVSSRLKSTFFGVRKVRRGLLATVARPGLWYKASRFEHLAANVVREARIDLIHSHFGWPQGGGGLSARAATGRPLVASLRGTDIVLRKDINYGRRQDRFFDASIRRLLRTADQTLYFSHYMLEHGLALGAVPARARVIRKGVDLARFTVAANRNGLREDLGFGSRPMILTVAGLIRLKGIHHILEALGHLRDRDFSFVICGEGPERQRLEELAQHLGLRDRTHFAGRVDRLTIPKYFAACDMFVLASVVEAAGNVVFEAMAAGRPVVSTTSGGPQEYIVDGETGFLVPVASPASLAERIGMLLDNPLLGDQLGREGRQRAVRELRYDRMITDVIDAYDLALRTHSSDRTPV